MKNIHLILKVIRIEQWVKNVFIFLPLFFAREFTSVDKVINCIIAFVGFSFIASSIYCFNDLRDIESDKVHPKKCLRPLASGKLSKTTGILIMIGCLAIGLGILLAFIKTGRFSVISICLFYYVLNIFYTLWLKQIAIIDVVIISIGFVIRIFIGGFASEVILSHWIVLMTFLIALFLAFAKRKDDYVIYDKSGVVARKNIVNYNSDFLNAALIITSTITIVSYIMYTVSPEVMQEMNSKYVYTTSLFVLLGILRYLQITLVKEKSHSPTQILLKDRFIQSYIVCWISAFVIIIYI